MSFAADRFERGDRRTGRSLAERMRLAAAFLLSLTLNLAVFGTLFYGLDDIEIAPDAVEIPVEMVPPPEQPPEPPPEEKPEQKPEEKQAEKKPEPPKPPPMTLDEKPATDAPRKETEEQVDREAPQQRETRGPQVSKPSDAASAPSKPQKAQNQDAATGDPEEQKEAEIVRPSAPVAGPPKPEAAPKKTETQKNSLATEEMIAAFKPLPDYEFGAAARKAPVAGGAAKATYLTILFGMVMPHMKIPPGAKPIQGGMVSFGLDETGRLTFAGTKISSGSPELDRAAIAAIRAAAPFPAPPTGRSIGLTFTYGADR